MNYIKKTTKFSFSIILLLIIICTSKLFSQDTYGEKLLKMNQFKTAKKYLSDQFKSNPSNTKNLYLLGETYFNMGKTDSAHFFFLKGISIDPNDYYCNIGIAKVLFEKSNPEDAKKILEKVKSLSKYKDAIILATIADACISSKNKHFELASENLEKAKEIDKTKALIHIVSGDLNSLKENLGDAANDYERAIYYDKNCAEAYYKLGKIYITARNFDESVKAFDNAIKTDSAFIPVWRDLAELYYAYGYYQKASDAFSKYIQLTEPELNDHIRYASILYFNKEYAKSLTETGNALQIDSKNFVMKRLNAYNLFETKDFNKSLLSINDYFKTTDESKYIATDFEYYGKILSKNNQDSLAIIAFEKCIKMDSTKTGLYENIGMSYDKQKKFSKSSEAYKSLISFKKNPFSSDYFLLGKSLYYFGGSLINSADSILKKQIFTEADSSFSKVTELSPNSYLGYFWKARVNALLDPETESGIAKPWYEKVISILETTPEKNKKELLESYQYLGYFYYLKKENELSKSYWNKILAIDPSDKKAQEAIKGMK